MFKRSSYCESGTCVEVQIGHETVVVMDPNGSEVVYTLEEWRMFILGAKNGEFDA